MSSSSSGGWQECVAPGAAIYLNPVLMPHALVSEADGTFTYKALPWAPREAGDDKSAPFPSFLGRRINDVFFARNRLGFLAGENVVLSRAGGKFYNFFREKASQVLDTDPIDIASTEQDISYLHSVVPFDEHILVFAPKAQLRLTSGQERFTPQTIEMKPAWHYENYDSVSPVAAGANVYFAVDRGEFSGVMELPSDQVGSEADEISEHVPRFIPRGLRKFAVCSAERLLFALSELEPSKLYVYSFYRRGADRLQSAWSYWDFPATDTILDIAVFASDLVLLIQRLDGLYVEAMPLSAGRSDTGSDHVTYLDRRVTQAQCTVAYSAAAMTTAVTLPYPVTVTQQPLLQVWTKTAAGLPRQVHHVLRDETTIVLAGDMTAAEFYVGLDFDSEYEFSEQFFRQNGAARSDGRLQLRRFKTVHGKTGGYVAEVGNAERVLADQVDIGAAAEGAWAALKRFNEDPAKFPGAAIALTPPSPAPDKWTGSYDTHYIGPLFGKLSGIPLDGRYQVRLTGSLSTVVAYAALGPDGSFSFPESYPGLKTLAVVRKADLTAIHSETFDGGGASGDLLLDSDESGRLLASAGGDLLALGVDFGKAGMLRGFSDENRCYTQAQALATVAAVLRQDQTEADAFMAGLGSLYAGYFPEVAERPSAAPVGTSRPTRPSTWALIAASRYLAAYPSGTSAYQAGVTVSFGGFDLLLRRSNGLLKEEDGTISPATNLLGWFAFGLAAQVTGSGDFTAAASGIATGLMSTLWNPAEGRFKENPTDSVPVPLETHALGALFLAATGRMELARLCLRWADYYASTAGSARGYSRLVPGLDGQGAYVGTGPAAWSSGTLLVALAKMAVGDRAGARQAYAELVPLFGAQGVGNATRNGEVVPAASAEATAMAVLAENPQGFAAVTGSPLRTEGTLPVEIARANSYRALEDSGAGNGDFGFPVDMKSTAARIKVKSLGALGFGLLSAAWEAFFSTRAQKV